MSASASGRHSDSDPEDYDELDDVIPSFTAPPPPPRAPPVAALSSAPSASFDPSDEEAFARELAREMESLFAGLNVPIPNSNPTNPTSAVPSFSSATGSGSSTVPPPKAASDGGDQMSEKEMKDLAETWERMFADALKADGAEGGNPEGNPTAPVPPKGPGIGGTGGGARRGSEGAAGSAGPGGFQASIKETMERLRASGENHERNANSPSPSDDPLAALLASLAEGGGAGDDDDLDGGGVLESMMDSLMSKEILFEPLKELSEKYPPYLTSPSALSLPQPTLHAYRAQSTLVIRIVTLFESPSYSDSNPSCKDEIRELMGKMQDLGAPPKEVMGEMPEGFELGEDGLPQLPNIPGLPGGGEGCIIC